MYLTCSIRAGKEEAVGGVLNCDWITGRKGAGLMKNQLTGSDVMIH